jgi:hypothetical protein
MIDLDCRRISPPIVVVYYWLVYYRYTMQSDCMARVSQCHWMTGDLRAHRRYSDGLVS